MPATFESFVLSWLATVAIVRFKGSGYAEYAGICRNHLLPAFGDTPIDGITVDAVQRYISEKVAAGVSPRTVENHIHVLRRILDHAVRCGLVNENAAKKASLPRQEKREMRFLTAEGIARLIDATAPSWRPLIAMAALTGVRRGEILALRFTDVDFDAGTISISRSMRNGVVTSCKTASSVAVLPMPETLSHLLAQRRRQAPDPKGLVFCRRDGSPLPDGLPNRILADALKRAGLPPMRFHDLRHSFVVMHLQSGTDIKTLQVLGRWAPSSTTLLETYAHVLPTGGKDAALRLDRLLKEGTTDPEGWERSRQ